jgi:t-SNARE complex subunit (syntaxin)
MVTRVNSGGLKDFVYDKDNLPKNTPEQNAEMDESWKRARKRKKKEKRIKIIVLVVLLILLMGYFIFLR